MTNGRVLVTDKLALQKVAPLSKGTGRILEQGLATEATRGADSSWGVRAKFVLSKRKRRWHSHTAHVLIHRPLTGMYVTMKSAHSSSPCWYRTDSITSKVPLNGQTAFFTGNTRGFTSWGHYQFQLWLLMRRCARLLQWQHSCVSYLHLENTKLK